MVSRTGVYMGACGVACAGTVLYGLGRGCAASLGLHIPTEIDAALLAAFPLIGAATMYLEASGTFKPESDSPYNIAGDPERYEAALDQRAELEEHDAEIGGLIHRLETGFPDADLANTELERKLRFYEVASREGHAVADAMIERYRPLETVRDLVSRTATCFKESLCDEAIRTARGGIAATIGFGLLALSEASMITTGYIIGL